MGVTIERLNSDLPGTSALPVRASPTSGIGPRPLVNCMNNPSRRSTAVCQQAHTRCDRVQALCHNSCDILALSNEEIAA